MLTLTPHGHAIASQEGAEGLLGLLGRRVDVYRNLHRGAYSVRDRATGRVIAHAEHVDVRDARGVVGQKGRERVIAEGVKNVHAVVRGTLTAPLLRPNTEPTGSLTYNPFKYTAFVDRATETDPGDLEWVALHERGVSYWAD